MKAQGAIKQPSVATRRLLGQAATEYLVLMSVVLGIALICVAILVWPTGSTKDVKASQSDIKCGIAKNAVPDIMQGMVAYWKFDGGSGTSAADNRGGHTGTLNNGTSWVGGKSAFALGFDGVDDYASIPDSATLEFSDDASFSLWYKKAASAGQWAGILHHIRTGYDAGSLSILETPDTLRVSGYTGAGAHPADYFSFNYGNTLNTDWHHVVLVFKKSASFSLYIDGSLVNSTVPSAGAIYNSAQEWNVGRATGSSYNGSIDEVLIFNRALSADEIKFLHEYPGCP